MATEEGEETFWVLEVNDAARKASGNEKAKNIQKQQGP